ncbi:MAG: hypothetical protein M3463_08240 [Verrucomicrobiota bacterium]|nr:hypothetical protein [Verrucomicrobiota bacterium]
MLRARDAYQEGLQCLLQQRFGEAVAHFHSAHELQPHDVATAVMLARASAISENPSDGNPLGPYFGKSEPGPAMKGNPVRGD